MSAVLPHTHIDSDAKLAKHFMPLFPYRDPDKIRLDTVRLLDRELLGIPHQDDDSATDPAALI